MSPKDQNAQRLAAKAQMLWASFDETNKFAARFGLFPAAEMEAAMQEGHDARDLAAALLDIASKNGGLRA